MTRRASLRGFTLVELIVAVAILSGVCLLIFGAFAGMKASKDGLQRLADRYREGRLAMARISRDVQSAYVSNHAPFDPSLQVVKTAFKASPGNPAYRLDFNSFCHRRLERDSHESDQAEISYFGSPDPDHSGVTDLARRESGKLDAEPTKGGKVEVLATDISRFELKFLDATTGMWTEEWDTTEATGQLNRLPVMMKIVLVLTGGERSRAAGPQQPLRFVAKIPIWISRPLTFATQ